MRKFESKLLHQISMNPSETSTVDLQQLVLTDPKSEERKFTRKWLRKCAEKEKYQEQEDQLKNHSDLDARRAQGGLGLLSQ